jgi:hypothetical protein
MRSPSTVLLAPAHRVVNADLGRIDVDHPPRHRPLEHLPKCLRCFEPIAGRQPHPPLGDLLRGQLSDLPLAEHCGCLAEQVTELLDRHRLDVMLRQIRLDELGEREPPRDARLSPKPLQLPLERLTRVLLTGEPATLHALRAATAGPIPVRP